MNKGFNAAALCALIFYVSAPLVWGQADDKAKLVEGAKKEGKLVWYTSTNVTESKPLLDDFEKIYPIVQSKLKLQVEPSQTGPQFNARIKEFRELFGL